MSDRPSDDQAPADGKPVPGQQNWSAPGGFERAQHAEGGAGESPSGYGAVPTGQGEERKQATEATPGAPAPDAPEGGKPDPQR